MRLKHILFGILMMLLVLSVSGATRAQDDTDSLLASQSRAKGTLLSLGASQQAFKSTSDDQIFGTFEELQNDLYINAAYTYTTMVENYELRLYMEPDRTGFTIIAMPTIESDPPMRMFAIDETMSFCELEPGEDPGNHIPNPPGEIRTRTDESPQLESPESITVYFEPMDNWTHNLHARYIYIETMDQWYSARGSYF